MTIPIKHPNLAKAKESALNVLRDNLIIKPPVIAEALARGYGLRVVYCLFKPEFNDIAGFINIQEKKIAVNREDPIYCQNFTIAHELGHYLLDHNLESPEYSCLFRYPEKQAKVPEENEANYFATNLLVPQQMLREIVDKYPFADDLQLSRLFGVPADTIKLQKFYP
jgi:Zn-dependent peptidase ImmA (M78 family)